MRDRTASRNYSTERDEFRREHERRRAFGLQRRHAERLRRLRDSRPAAATCPPHPAEELPPSPASDTAHRGSRAAPSRAFPAGRDLPRTHGHPSGQPTPGDLPQPDTHPTGQPTPTEPPRTHRHPNSQPTPGDLPQPHTHPTGQPTPRSQPQPHTPPSDKPTGRTPWRPSGKSHPVAAGPGPSKCPGQASGPTGRDVNLQALPDSGEPTLVTPTPNSRPQSDEPTPSNPAPPPAGPPQNRPPEGLPQNADRPTRMTGWHSPHPKLMNAMRRIHEPGKACGSPRKDIRRNGARGPPARKSASARCFARPTGVDFAQCRSAAPASRSTSTSRGPRPLGRRRILTCGRYRHYDASGGRSAMSVKLPARPSRSTGSYRPPRTAGLALRAVPRT